VGAHFHHEGLARSCGVAVPNRKSVASSREDFSLSDGDWLPHAGGQPESCSQVLCIDPGRLGFQIDPPCVQNRERLSADAEI
jgi:hypothetical protein